MKEYKQVSNENGLTLDIIHPRQITEFDEPHTFLGGDSSNPSWDEYLEDYADEFKGHIMLIKKSIEENNMIGWKGEDVDDIVFKFSDSNAWSFSWRGWGDLMQSIVNKNEGYMAYYM